MKDWNVIVTIRDGGFARACALLGEFGAVNRTGLYNVVALRVADVGQFLEALRSRIEAEPGVRSDVGRVAAITQAFSFQSPEDFETHASEVVLQWAPRLAGKKFHVRMHRRGFQGRMSSQQEEHVLDKVLMEALAKTGTPGQIAFDDPDAIIDVETVGNRAGLAFWTREDLQRYPFLNLD
jgi:tRNA(Ser,Leu) C12 N-acetylase TAN1